LGYVASPNLYSTLGNKTEHILNHHRVQNSYS